MATTSAETIRADLDHPVIDIDAHQLEIEPLLFDYLRREAGADAEAGARQQLERVFSWYWQSDAERRAFRTVRPPWGLQSDSARHVATCMAPRLLRDRLPSFGIDFAVTYPTLGMPIARSAPEPVRAGLCRALNRYYADVFADVRDRLMPVAIVPMHHPDEAIAVLEDAASLGHKVAVIDCAVRRPVPRAEPLLADLPPELRPLLTYLDSFGIDSAHDYDPLWKRFSELGVSITAHQAGLWGARRSVSNYVANHLGMFAAAGEALCKSLFLGGVTFRMPELRIAFLEGGAGWACSLYAGLVEHWEKRGGAEVEHFDPAHLRRDELAAILAEHWPQKVGEPPDLRDPAAFRNLDVLSGWLPEAGWEPRRPELLDEFSRCDIAAPEDIAAHFAPNFYFGCEADDPSIGWALSGRGLPGDQRLHAMFGSDIGHWDVADPTEVVAEAHEGVEHGLISADDFRDYSFANAVRFHGAGAPDFFAGTAVAAEARALLARTDEGG